MELASMSAETAYPVPGRGGERAEGGWTRVRAEPWRVISQDAWKNVDGRRGAVLEERWEALTDPVEDR